MKISTIEFKKDKMGIGPFKSCELGELGDVVILTGANGSGKSRFLKSIEKYINDLHIGNEEDNVILNIMDESGSEVKLDLSNANHIEVINYSHYDAKLQIPNNFTPYVIHNAKTKLERCNYEETALNSLLFLCDMMKGYSDEFKDGKYFEEFCLWVKEKFNIELSADESNGEKSLEIFGRKPEDAGLSPGQRYLLRIAVACFRNQKVKDGIFFLDEPELHLHPQALINVITCLRNTFSENQFWISTHSLALISYLTAAEEKCTVITMMKGKPFLFRSNSSVVLDGLMGTSDNIVAMRALLCTPDEYACNRFSIECNNPPDVVSAKKGDPQNEMIEILLKERDTVVDYGVGKGRFFEGLGIDCADTELAKKINYFAYDKSEKYAEKCKTIMVQYGSRAENYYNDVEALKEKVSGKSDYVLLVNVLHEIDPIYWEEVFGNIKALLNENGSLIIVERSRLTVGEAPYKNGFLVLTRDAAKELFGEGNVECKVHSRKEYIEKYTIKKGRLDVSKENICLCVEKIQQDAYASIKRLKGADDTEKDYKNGLEMAFWLHQYANASLIKREFKD